MALKIYLREAGSVRKAAEQCCHLAVTQPDRQEASTLRRLRGKFSKIEAPLHRWAQEEIQERHWRRRSPRRINPADATLFDSSVAKVERFNVAKADRPLTTRTDLDLFPRRPAPRPERTIGDDDLRKALDDQDED